MRHQPVFVVLAVLLGGCATEEGPAASPGRPTPAEAGPIPLFDGRTLAGWKTTDGLESWGVEEGGILALKTPGGGQVITEARFGDFELDLEFRNDGGTDSGIFFRWTDPADPQHTALELQIADGPRPGPAGPGTTGALASLAIPATDAVRPTGEWNTLHLVCEGRRIRAAVNGRDVLDVDLARWTEAGRNPDGTANRYPVAACDLPLAGHLGFENRRSFVWWRNIRLRPLGPGR